MLEWLLSYIFFRPCHCVSFRADLFLFQDFNGIINVLENLQMNTTFYSKTKIGFFTKTVNSRQKPEMTRHACHANVIYLLYCMSYDLLKLQNKIIELSYQITWIVYFELMYILVNAVPYLLVLKNILVKIQYNEKQ